VKRELSSKVFCVNFNDWLNSVPAEITGDTLWKMEAYRLALFVSDLGWYDVTKLMSDKRAMDLSSQLYRELGSVGANLSEGYSRGTGRDRARFYEYALGSARESRDWYCKGRHILAEKVVQHRLGLLTEIIRLLLKTVPEQRGAILREESSAYYCESENENAEEAAIAFSRADLFEDIPMP
jgi:four helix bundle protein